MNSRFLLTALFLTAAVFLSAEPRTVSGSDRGPVVALISGTEGTVTLWHEDTAVRAWAFPGEFTCAVVLAGPLDKLEWDGVDAVVTDAGSNPLDSARQTLGGATSPRVLLANADGSTEILKAVEGEESYDAVTAASAEE